MKKIINDCNLPILGNAIVYQAVIDWIDARAKLAKVPDDVSSTRMLRDCEHFFRSDEFSLFSDLDGNVLLQRMKEGWNDLRHTRLSRCASTFLRSEISSQLRAG